MGIKDSLDLAWQDWQGTRRVRPATTRTCWARRWAARLRRVRRRREAGLAARARHPVLPGRRLGRARRRRARRPRQLGAPLPHHLGHRPGRASRRSSDGCASRPRRAGSRYAFRHRVDELVDRGRRRHGVRGAVLAPTPRRRAACPPAARRSASSSSRAQAVVVTSGGIGGNHDLVRATGPSGSARPPRAAWSPGCPPTSTAGCSASPRTAGGRLVNRDRMWHYIEGMRNWDPIWPGHGIRILPGPSSMWFDARRPPAARRRSSPASTPSARCDHLRHTGHDHSWFVLTRTIIEKEFALSGSEQNPDLTGQAASGRCSARVRHGRTRPGGGVPAPRRGLRRRRHAAPSSSPG